MTASKPTGKESRRLHFPLKLFQMLEDASDKNFAHIVSWNSDGSGFFVHDRASFTNQIIPQYFNQTKYKSFQRQLCLYGFQRIAAGKHKGCRYNKFFQRRDRDLCRQMKYSGANPGPKTSHSSDCQQDSAKPESSAQSPRGGESDEHRHQGLLQQGSQTDEATLPHQSYDQASLPTPSSHRLPSSPKHVSDCESLGSYAPEAVNNEVGVFEGMSFHCMAPKASSDESLLVMDEPMIVQETKQETAPPSVIDCDLWTSHMEHDEKLRKAWDLGFSFALSLPTEQLLVSPRISESG